MWVDNYQALVFRRRNVLCISGNSLDSFRYIPGSSKGRTRDFDSRSVSSSLAPGARKKGVVFMEEIDKQQKKEHNKRLIDLYNFLHIICIEGGCGYNLKDICSEIIIGRIGYEEVLEEWKKCGHLTLN